MDEETHNYLAAMEARLMSQLNDAQQAIIGGIHSLETAIKPSHPCETSLTELAEVARLNPAICLALAARR